VRVFRNANLSINWLNSSSQSISDGHNVSDMVYPCVLEAFHICPADSRRYCLWLRPVSRLFAEQSFESAMFSDHFNTLDLPSISVVTDNPPSGFLSPSCLLQMWALKATAMNACKATRMISNPIFVFASPNIMRRGLWAYRMHACEKHSFCLFFSADHALQPVCWLLTWRRCQSFLG